jgi:hypothetical protein
MAQEDAWAFPTPIDKAERIASERDDVELGVYGPEEQPLGPILVADDKAAFVAVRNEYGLSGSEYPRDRMQLGMTADEVRSTDTLVGALGLE